MRWLVLLAKVGCVVAVIIQLRWTLPRFRFDQLMGLAWRGMIPLGVLNLAAVIFVMSFDNIPRWTLAPVTIAFLLAAAALNAKAVATRSRQLASA